MKPPHVPQQPSGPKGASHKGTQPGSGVHIHVWPQPSSLSTPPEQSAMQGHTLPQPSSLLDPPEQSETQAHVPPQLSSSPPIMPAHLGVHTQEPFIQSP